ncbi:hypothetical protein EVAR_89955_1 [Eumeta japonica]|uniref:Uncharacterized protein n=1 Tax=Eumeta variegata TaxID=151549 RepID=A0A4C2AA27_EUMVA|nr:hypothetical protein EVAR_89955_1 [Eumeta japonica]
MSARSRPGSAEAVPRLSGHNRSAGTAATRLALAASNFACATWSSASANRSAEIAFTGHAPYASSPLFLRNGAALLALSLSVSRRGFAARFSSAGSRGRLSRARRLSSNIVIPLRRHNDCRGVKTADSSCLPC